MNYDNLRSFSERTDEEAQAIRSAGGKASSQVRREKKAIRENLKTMLELRLGDYGEEMMIEEAQSLDHFGLASNPLVGDAILYAQVRKAMSGDTAAFKAIMDYLPPEAEKDNRPVVIVDTITARMRAEHPFRQVIAAHPEIAHYFEGVFDGVGSQGQGASE